MACDDDVRATSSDTSNLTRRNLLIGSTALAAGAVAVASMASSAAAQAQTAAPAGKKPNILVIFGDDIGIPQISAYTMGLMGYRTPNIDRIAREGAIFTDSYGQQSCTAGRASFILGQEPFRTGLLTIGMPGDPHGIQDWMPTIADVLKTQGYATGQFGKNHLGDQDQHLPTKHGFDEFFGNLYHLNAEEEPEGYFYPKDPAFRRQFGPRGVIKSSADGKIEDTGELNTKRMETIDEEFLAAAKNFIDRQAKADKPFFCWFNSTRMHVFTHLKADSLGKTGKGIHADGMVEHDGHVGQLLDQLDQLGIAENTIVLYTTDNGAELALWPDGAMTMFHGEKGTTWEGGFRIPMMVRWPGVVKPGTEVNEIVTLMDWMPTFASVAGIPDVKEQMKAGFKAGTKDFKVHLDGYDLGPLLKGEVPTGPRDAVYYFDQGGNLNAIRWNDWKLSFAINSEGNIATATREIPAWANIANLRMDPYERGMKEGGGAIEFLARNMWLLVPVQAKIKDFFSDFTQFPYQEGSSLNASGINYALLRQQAALKRLNDLERLAPQ
ncbi:MULTISPECIES: arylsulfatase [unclassified Rhizobium]|uniref:arylsulfatase n=1 Tax=unclassified Rhizobium TaxID=2613769 RepID=UPI00161EFE65|nr:MULTISPECIES: arylsulfatase [unclassified Rhizobium]MBB3542535.1 arylsulfatase [Rhizobium sp. BK399]MCS3739333.1 arylsulfatase [Rhizobium sp. BK661]MCS4091483.1 arylsulfatase [Rhizobium sp. BK176]